MLSSRLIRSLLIMTPLAALVAALAYLARPHGAAPALPAPSHAPTPAAPPAAAPLLVGGQLSAAQQTLVVQLAGLVMVENLRIAQDRRRLEEVSAIYLHEGDISEQDFNWLKALAETYHLQPQRRTDSRFFDELIARVDTAPASLVLAQAVLEASDQGTLVKAGVGPSDWDAPRVQRYLLTLNTAPAYAGLRERRASLRQDYRKPDGLTLVGALPPDALRGPQDAAALREVIRWNRLDLFD